MQERPEQQVPEKKPAETQQQMAENPNPRANENIKHTPFEEKNAAEESVGTEITDGEAG
jgi:hypothetical protein